jgi:ABC-type multidrug transport system permease subunit
MFPKGFAIGKNASNEIRFAVDYSQMNLVWTVLNAMTAGISARSYELSRNLTSVILNAVEFTRREVAERKQTLVDLTTENDEIGQRLSNVQAELAEIELAFDPAEFGLGNLTSSKTIVKNWVDNSLALGRNALAEARHFINAADGLVRSSAAGSSVGTALAASLQASITDIGELSERLETTESIVQSEYSGFSRLIDHIAGRITQAKSQLDMARSAQVFTIDELDLARGLLDQALLNILVLQKSLNGIDKVISAIQVTDPEAIVQPVRTSIIPVVAEKSYLNYLFPSLMALVMMFTALLIAPTIVLFERNSPAYFRNFMTPAKGWVFVASIFVSVALLLLVQLAVILAVAAIFFTQMLNSLAIGLVVVLLFASICIFIGMIVGYVFPSEETAMLASIALGTVMLFLSGIVIPVESMPGFMMKLSSMNPLALGSSLLRRSLLFNAPLSEMLGGIFLLVLFAVIACALLIAVYCGLKRHAFSKYLARLAPKKEQMQ